MSRARSIVASLVAAWSLVNVAGGSPSAHVHHSHHHHQAIPLKRLAPATSGTAGCPAAFQKIGSRCYFYGYFKLNWFRAAEFCHSFGDGAALACVETEKENNDIKNWLNKHGDENTGVWLGGSDNGHKRRWAWFPTGQLVKWFNWGPGQPSGGEQHCMYLVGGFLGYQWADFHCGFEMTFLCEHQANDDIATRSRSGLLPQFVRDQEDDSWDLTLDNRVDVSNTTDTVREEEEVVVDKIEKLDTDDTTWSIYQFIRDVVQNVPSILPRDKIKRG